MFRQTFVLLVGGVDLSVASVMATLDGGGGFAATENFVVPAIFAAAIAGSAWWSGLRMASSSPSVTSRRSWQLSATTIVLQGLRFLYTQGSDREHVAVRFSP